MTHVAARPQPATQPHRLPAGGLINRARTLSFRFDGRALTGHPGDTLASALLAHGIRRLAHGSGILADGPEDPVGRVALRGGVRHEPNAQAATVEVFDGLRAWSRARLAPGPDACPRERDPDTYDHAHTSCDVLVVGAGPAGLMAALTAARMGARVILADARPALGGCLRRERLNLDGAPAMAWGRAVRDELSALDTVTVRLRTTVVAPDEGHGLLAVERVADHRPEPPAGRPRQRLWRIRARQTVLATGATERPLVFAGNARPGVMLAGAVRSFLNQYAVAPGRTAVLFASHDEAYRTALDLHAAGLAVAAVVDPRPDVRGPLPDRVRALGLPLRDGHVVADTRAARDGSVASVLIAPYAQDDDSVSGGAWVDADLLAVSGGWSPSLHLHAQSGARPVWDSERLAFLPDPRHGNEWMCGGCAGVDSLDAVFADGRNAGRGAAEALGRTPTAWRTRPPPLPALDADEPAIAPAGTPPRALWAVPAPASARGARLVDVCRGVTVDAITDAQAHGCATAESLRRVTGLGTGPDQGATSTVIGLALLAQARGIGIEAVGPSPALPPVTPIPIGTLAGPAIRAVSPRHRTACFARTGETPAEATRREAQAAISDVGLADLSGQGRVDLRGTGAATLLARICDDETACPPVGQAAQRLLPREDGSVMDIATIVRLAEDHVVLITPVAASQTVAGHLSRRREARWPDLKAEPTPASDAWTTVLLVGPKSRILLEAVADMDVSDTALPPLGVAIGEIRGLPAQVVRTGFAGALGYEVSVPTALGDALWRQVVMSGRPFGLTPCGSDALDILRIEAGQAGAPELEGRPTAHELGLGPPRPSDPERQALVGLVGDDPGAPLPAGAIVLDVANADAPPPVPIAGHVTSTCDGPRVGQPVALAALRGGLDRWEGQTVVVAHPLKGLRFRARVTAPGALLVGAT